MGSPLGTAAAKAVGTEKHQQDIPSMEGENMVEWMGDWFWGYAHTHTSH
jgi:hypothetical protein